jgi:alkyl hydroperoxide reductase subunit F
MYDLIIIGGGPAGAAAAIYAARKQLKTMFVTADWGGQSAVSSEIQNWVGTPTIMGADLADSLKKHVLAYQGDVLEIRSPEWATKLSTFDDHIEVETKGGTITARAALVATGAERRKLEIPGAAEFDQKGLTYCASCDGPLFSGMDVAVIGGGNAAFETSLQLVAYCKSVTLFNRSETFRADEITIAAARAHANMHIVQNAEPVRVVGEKFVNGFVYRDTTSGEEKTVPVAGIFVEIGLLPNTEWIGDTLAKNAVGQVKVDPRTQRASHPRVWAAGDCTDGIYHQNNIAAGDAVKALEDVYMFLRKNKSEA